MRILNFGSLNIDYVYRVPHFVQRGETLLSTERHIFAGGKGLNQSVAMSRASVISVTRPGAAPSVPTRQEADCFLPG